jgi:alcohol dehydrogenase class IV
MHTPIHVTELGHAIFHERRADCVIALGGWSTTGLGEAIAVRTGADQVVIPTSYAGSETTDILGETVGGEKTTRIYFRPSVLEAKRASWPQPRPLAQGRAALPSCADW